jgi:tRNA(Leu) C34 or U34 (ribose-2'-O)-methylase TrmL
MLRFTFVGDHQRACSPFQNPEIIVQQESRNNKTELFCISWTSHKAADANFLLNKLQEVNFFLFGNEWTKGISDTLFWEGEIFFTCWKKAKKIM